jgi:hypothetical protein
MDVPLNCAPQLAMQQKQHLTAIEKAEESLKVVTEQATDVRIKKKQKISKLTYQQL